MRLPLSHHAVRRPHTAAKVRPRDGRACVSVVSGQLGRLVAAVLVGDVGVARRVQTRVDVVVREPCDALVVEGVKGCAEPMRVRESLMIGEHEVGLVARPELRADVFSDTGERLGL